MISPLAVIFTLMALSQKQLTDVCLLHQIPQQCAYLEDSIENGRAVHWCQKLSPPNRKIIDEELEEFFDDCKKSGRDPSKEGQALGDNCPGYLPLKTKLQGYDVK